MSVIVSLAGVQGRLTVISLLDGLLGTTVFADERTPGTASGWSAIPPTSVHQLPSSGIEPIAEI
jgi:hypothetical protein